MIKLKSLEITGKDFDCGNINIIIGANNSGKSTLLREISYASGLQIPADTAKWLTSVSLEVSGQRDKLESLMPRIFTAQNFDDVREYQKLKTKFFNKQTGGSNNQYYDERFYQDSKATDNNVQTYTIDNTSTLQQNSSPVLKFLVAYSFVNEYCEQRLSTDDIYQTAVNLATEPATDTAGFYWRNPTAFAKVQASMSEAFNGLRIGFDDIIQSTHNVRILPEVSITGDNRLPEYAEEWDLKSPYLSSQGDGIKAYYRILTSISNSDRDVIFIDEPESFLHPPQRRDLGRAVAKLASSENKQVFIATHDSEFLRGLLDTKFTLKLFLLKNKSQQRSLEVIDSANLEALTRAQNTLKSNLLNERVLNSFFYEKTIVCESENDRVFYEYSSAHYHWEDFQQVNFIGGMNGHPLAGSIYKKMQEMHINSGLAVDVDFLLDGNLGNICSNQSLITDFSNMKLQLRRLIGYGGRNRAITDARRKTFKGEGIKMIRREASQLTSDFENLLSDLSAEQIYVVPIGEMESFTGVAKNDLDSAIGIVNKQRKRNLSAYTATLLKR